MNDIRRADGHKTFADSLPKRIRLVELAAAELGSASPDRGIVESGALAAHSLIGAAPMFGRIDLGELAQAVESAFRSITTTGPDAGTLALLRSGVAALKAAAELSPAENLPPVSASASAANSPPRMPATTGNRLLLIEDDEDLAAELVNQLAAFDWDVECVTDAAQAGDRLTCHSYRAIVADIMLPEGPLAGTELLRALPAKQHLPPIIFISSRWDWEARLSAVRANAAAYLPKPIDVSRLIETLDRLSDGNRPRGGRILLVDDDIDLARHFSRVLNGAGHEVATLSDAGRLLELIPEFVPELIIMDLHMPRCSGIEVARVLRQDDANIGIPILFLSGDSNRGPAQEAIIAGADDFLLKPIGDDWLVAAVNARIIRARAVNSLAQRDSMTGLLNHLAIKQHLELEMSAAAREQTPLCFAMVDLDHFKKINDTYGHPVGDKVIRSVAQLLKQRLRRSDAVGRYGGEEFAIVLRDADINAAKTILNKIRESFAGLRFNCHTGSFSGTLSVGVSQMHYGESAESIVKRADEALYVAKRASRNIVITAD